MGWWRGKAPTDESINGIRHIWGDVARSVEIGGGLLEDPDGLDHQLVAFVRFVEDVEQVPLQPLQESLHFVVDRGAVIAWAGGHECDREFDDNSGGERCFAAFTELTGFVCAANSGNYYLCAAELKRLREAITCS